MKRKELRVLVFGGTGFYGKHIVESLLKKNVKVSVVSRNANKVSALFGEKAIPIEGDVRDSSFLKGVCKDQDAVVIALSAMTWKLIKFQKAIERDAVLQIIEEAKRCKCRKLIYLSGYEIRMDVLRDLGIEKFGRIKNEIELTLAKTDLNYTILGCAPSFELFFALLNKGKITIPGGGKNPFPSIAAEDVGEIGAQCVLRNDLSGKRIRLTGAKAYSVPEFAALLHETTGIQTRVREVPLQAIHIVAALFQVVNPFLRELYMSLKLLNNFPEALAARVEDDHQYLLDTFDYNPHSLHSEIQKRWEQGSL
jgi:uncharacterized protein YbjT (DUF2867 family)